VIKLKHRQTSDATVGQVLRYRNWVREHLAEGNQQVWGIIVAVEVDDALRYAIKGLPDIAVLTYQVEFHLQPIAS
jgi:RecB family endonuclease NucS